MTSLIHFLFQGHLRWRICLWNNTLVVTFHPCFTIHVKRYVSKVILVEKVNFLSEKSIKSALFKNIFIQGWKFCSKLFYSKWNTTGWRGGRGGDGALKIINSSRGIRFFLYIFIKEYRSILRNVSLVQKMKL